MFDSIRASLSIYLCYILLSSCDETSFIYSSH